MRSLIIALAAICLAGLIFACGWRSGADHATATQAATEALITATAAEVETRTAKRISGIRVVHQTIQGQVREVVHESTVYRDCPVDDATRRLLDAARAATSGPGPDSGSVPAAGPGAPP